MLPALQNPTSRIFNSFKYFFAGALVLLSLSNGSVKDVVFTGKVVDEKGRPVPNATIKVKGMRDYTQANAGGDFRLVVKSLPVTIVCSAVGFVSEEKLIVQKDLKGTVPQVLIKLRTAMSKLDEVVVVGYSEAKRKRMPGAIPSDRAYYSDREVAATLLTTSTRTAVVSGKKEMAVAMKKIAGSKTTVPVSLAITKTPGAPKRTSLLTAGEVNDFRKWKMWEDYNETDFKIHASKWNLYATRRFSVQLQNHDFKAMAGIRVHLINRRNGDTIWTAVSDNTGKAELWKGFSNQQEENDLLIAVEKEAKQFSAIPFTQGINKIMLNRSCTVSNKVEIAFVVDATGSMQDEIEYLKEELADILTKVSARDHSLELHTGSVFYRDKGDAYVTSVQPLAPGIRGTVAFIKKQYADGGGDFPEALKEALQDATGKLKWSRDARTKIIFLLMDAPPHDDAKGEMTILIKNAAALGIRIVPVACSGTDKATEFIMRSMALATNGTYLFLTDDSGIGNPHIKPTTDEFKVELLNDLMQRTIEQMCFVNDCSPGKKGVEPLTLYTNIEKVKLFPNPTRGPVVLETSKELREIYVADFTGKILLRKEINQKSGKYRLDLSAFPSATYYIRYTTKENKTGAEKLVLAR